MTIGTTILISVAGVCFTGIFGFALYLRNKKTDDQAEASQSATILTELKNIQSGITDIKKEMQDIKSNAREDHDLIIRQDESLKSAWIIINELRNLLNQKSERLGKLHE